MRWNAARDPAASALKPVTEDTLQTWWQTFNDSGLNRLMDQARSGSPDLQQAFTRIEQARAQRRVERADLFPQVSAVVLGIRQENLIPGGLPVPAVSNLFLTGFDAIWKLDLFGRQRRQLEATTAQYWNYEKAVLAALHETETALIQFLKEEQWQQTLARSLAKLKQSLQQTELLYREGLATFLEVLDAQRAVYAEELELVRSQTQTNLITLYKALGGSGQLPVKPAADLLRLWG